MFIRRRRIVFVFAALLMALPALGRPARAHQLQVEPVAVVIRPQENFIHAEFAGNVQDITQIPGAMASGADRQGDGFTPAFEKRLEAYLNENFVLRQNGTVLPGTITSLRQKSEIDPTRARFRLFLRYAKAANGPLSITSTLFDYLPNALTTVNVGGFQRNLRPGESAAVDPSALAVNLLTNVRDFLLLGMVHIFEGMDHVLFILALLLVAPSLKSLIKTLTGFTIAHSITLILSTLGVITLPGRAVEIFVALSIVYVGLENLRGGTGRHRFWIASGFGLVHGFAFAQNLREAGLPEGNGLFWSLLSFNLGVETAQVLICLAAFPLLMLWKRGTERRQKYGGMTWKSVVRTASLGVVIAGGYWLLQRVLG